MIELVPVGNPDEAILEALRQPLEEVFGQGTRIGGSIALPRESWNQHRGQHLASLLLAGLPLLTHSVCFMLPVSSGIVIRDYAKIKAWAIKFSSIIMLPLSASHRVFSIALRKKVRRLCVSVAVCAAPDIIFAWA